MEWAVKGKRGGGALPARRGLTDNILGLLLVTSVSRVGGKPCHTKKKTPNLFYQIYPILASLKVLITYGKLSEQNVMRLAIPR